MDVFKDEVKIEKSDREKKNHLNRGRTVQGGNRMERLNGFENGSGADCGDPHV